MIRSPIHRDVEIRVLRAIFSKPRLLASVPNTGVNDFTSVYHQQVWAAIRNVEWATTPDPVATSEQLKNMCSVDIRVRHNEWPHCTMMQLSDEIIGVSPTRYLDRMILVDDGQTEDRARDQLVQDAGLLELSRISRERSESRQVAAAERRK